MAEIPNPFAGTLWDGAGKEQRRRLYVNLGLCWAAPVRHRGAAADSWATRQLRKGRLLGHTDKALGQAALNAVMAERKRAAEIAASFSPEAAMAIATQEIPKVETI